jgi:hypothetical protein
MSLTSYRAAPPRDPIVTGRTSWRLDRTAQAHSSIIESLRRSRRLILRECLGDGLFEGVTAQIFGDDLAFAVEQERRSAYRAPDRG